jgi:DNA-directed RNA polymerase subunit RPC12/RpoP
LAQLDEDALEAALARGDVWPEMARSDAVRLRHPQTTGPDEKAAPEQWSCQDAEARIRAAVDAELRRCPPGTEREIVTVVTTIATDLERGQNMREHLGDAGLNALGLYRDELVNATPGERIFVRKRKHGPTVDVLAQPSTYPKDMGGFPRTRAGADRAIEVSDHVYAGKICGKPEREYLAWAAAQDDEEDVERRDDHVGDNDLDVPADRASVAFVCSSCGAIVWQAAGGQCPKCSDSILIEQLAFPRDLFESSNTDVAREPAW